MGGKEIQIDTVPGQAIYATINDDSDAWWGTASKAFVSPSSTTYANLVAIALAESTVIPGHYAGPFPQGAAGTVARGLYTVRICQQQPGTPGPLANDPCILSYSFDWNGIAEQGAAAVAVDANGLVSLAAGAFTAVQPAQPANQTEAARTLNFGTMFYSVYLAIVSGGVLQDKLANTETITLNDGVTPIAVRPYVTGPQTFTRQAAR